MKNERSEGFSKNGPRKEPGLSTPLVFDFDDYRLFLKAVIQHKQIEQSQFSLQSFSKKIGFASHAGLAMILSGKRELKSPYLDKCTRFLKLSAREATYFENLVAAKSQYSRSQLKNKSKISLETWEPAESTDGQNLVNYMIIQQILNLYKPRYVSLKTIQEHFRYQISVAEIQTGLEWLKKQDLVESHQDQYKSLKSYFFTKDEVPNSCFREAHKAFMKLAAQALDHDPVENREFQTYLMSIDSRNIPKIKEKIKKATIEILSEYETELDADTLIQFHFNFFEAAQRTQRRSR